MPQLLPMVCCFSVLSRMDCKASPACRLVTILLRNVRQFAAFASAACAWGSICFTTCSGSKSASRRNCSSTPSLVAVFGQLIIDLEAQTRLHAFQDIIEVARSMLTKFTFPHAGRSSAGIPDRSPSRPVRNGSSSSLSHRLFPDRRYLHRGGPHPVQFVLCTLSHR